MYQLAGVGTREEEQILHLQVALQQAATDPVTGAIDMDLIQTGVSASERVARAQLAQEIKTLLISMHAWPPLSARTGTELLLPANLIHNTATTLGTPSLDLHGASKAADSN